MECARVTYISREGIELDFAVFVESQGHFVGDLVQSAFSAYNSLYSSD